jgi:methyltransferase
LTLLGKKLGIAIPDTVLEERGSPREKAVKLGSIARACAIYGVDAIEVYRDTKGLGESRMIRKVLEYLETPQYLRKRLFPMDAALQYAGILPPLKIPSHKSRVSLDQLRVGDVREGVTNADGTVDVGLEKPLMMREGMDGNKRVTVRVASETPMMVEIVGREDAKAYWGYAVETKTVEEVLGDRRFGLKIATSRYGEPLRSQIDRLRGALAEAGSVLLIFGSPSRGLFDIIGKSLVDRVDFVLNLFVEQHVETVRTEEAISAALCLVDVLSV